MPRKLCRAIACPRQIADNELFCSVHLGVMSPKYLQPIASNREPSGVSDDVRRIRRAVNEAVTDIAKQEGRSETLRTARTRGSINPAQSSPVGGPDTGIDRGGGGGGGRYYTDRYLEE